MKAHFLAVVLFGCLAACSSEGSVAPRTSPAEQPVTPADPSSSPDGKGSGPDASGPAAPACEPLTPRTKPLELFVQPDVKTAPFSDTIGRATKSIDVMVYEMGYGPILDGLEAKAKAGVAVRVILDLSQKDTNQKYMTKLQAAGANVIWSDPQFSYMHAKMTIVDGVEALVSTGNYSESYMLKERNYAVRDTDPADVALLTKLFEADFTRAQPDLSCTRMLVSPVNARQRLLDFIASAKSTLVVHSMQLADNDLKDALVARKAAGVDVRVLLADPSWIDTNTAAAAFLASKDIPARWLTTPTVHVKAMVADGKTAYVGSINLSYTSMDKNREVGMLVTEPANTATVLSTFEKDWAAATAF